MMEHQKSDVMIVVKVSCGPPLTQEEADIQVAKKGLLKSNILKRKTEKDPNEEFTNILANDLFMLYNVMYDLIYFEKLTL